MQKAIIDTDTRVIKRLTTDDDPPVIDTESVIELSADIDLQGGFWKLNNKNKKVSATDEEIDAANVDSEKIAIKRKLLVQNLNNTVDEIVENGTSTELLNNYFQLLKELR